MSAEGFLAQKGCVNRMGESIDGSSSGRGSDRVAISKGLGEPWVCSRQESVPSGWR